MTDAQWHELRQHTTNALAKRMAYDSDVIATNTPELSGVARRMVDYWARALDGADVPAGTRYWQVQARLLVEVSYDDPPKHLAPKVQRNLVAMADAGLALLKAGFAGGNTKSP